MLGGLLLGDDDIEDGEGDEVEEGDGGRNYTHVFGCAITCSAERRGCAVAICDTQCAIDEWMDVLDQALCLVFLF